MGKSAKPVLGAAAVTLLVVAGTFLPGELATGGDRRILGQVRGEPLDAAELSDYVNISMVEKVGLLGQTAGTTPVPLKTGAVYDQDTIREKFLEEIGKLYEMRFSPLSANGELRSFNAGVTLYIQNDAPAVSMIVWEINIRTESGGGVFYLDDQTGKILGFDYSGNGSGDYLYREEMISAWGAYLGADIRNIRSAPEESGEGTGGAVFLFELYSGSRSVGGRTASQIPEAGGQNRWSLQYPRTGQNRNAVFPGE